jgi:hypothetical protein
MSQHWYTKEGTPCHTVENKSKGGVRPTTIGDAKKLSLVPSVSAYIAMQAADGLNNVKIERVMESAHSLAAKGNVGTLAEFAANVKEAAFGEWDDARDLGTLGHAALECYFGQQPYDPDALIVTPAGTIKTSDLIDPVIAAVEELNIMPTAAEKVVVSVAHGYAGTTDLTWESDSGEMGVLDFKFKKNLPKKPIKQHAMQCAAYWQAEWGAEYDWEIPAMACCYNVYVSTSDIGKVVVQKWDDIALREAWVAFKACLALYRFENSWDPRKSL